MAGSVRAEVNDWADEVDEAFESVADRGLELDEEDVRSTVERVPRADRGA